MKIQTERLLLEFSAVAPFRSDERWAPRLTATYIRTLDLILFLVGARQPGKLTVALPLLGTGARGAEPEEGAEQAAAAVRHFAGQLHEGGGLVLRFAVQEEPRAGAALAGAFDGAGWRRLGPGEALAL